MMIHSASAYPRLQAREEVNALYDHYTGLDWAFHVSTPRIVQKKYHSVLVGLTLARAEIGSFYFVTPV